MFTVNCINCGDVDFDTIKRHQEIRLSDSQKYIEVAVTIHCTECDTKTVDVTPYGLSLFCDPETVKDWEKQRVPIQRRLDHE